MRTIQRDAEQLTEAVQLLRKGTATGARLALILLDNLAELLLHRRVRYEIGWDDHWHSGDDRKIPPKLRRGALRSFEPKIELLLSSVISERLSPYEVEMLCLCHRLRNEAYHEGIVRDQILPGIAEAYLYMVRDLWPRFWDQQYGSTQLGEDTEFLRKYGCEGGGVIDSDALSQVAHAICGSQDATSVQLLDVMGEDLVERIDNAIEVVEDLATNVHDSPTPEVFLKRLQFSSVETVPRPTDQSHEAFVDFLARYDQGLDKYDPLVNLGTLRQWREDGSKLPDCRDDTAGVRFFNEADAELVEIERLVYDAAYHFDQ